eukprot:scaffold10022_cov170-Amphora_coffeaeformis.AAC.17
MKLSLDLLLWIGATKAVLADSFSLQAKTSSPPTASVWKDLPAGSPDAILVYPHSHLRRDNDTTFSGIAAAFRASTDPRKVNVCVGAYRDETGQPWVLPSVRAAEERLLTDNKEYLPIEGDVAYIDKALQFAYGADMDVKNRVAGVQSLSGTGACRIGGQFLANFYPGVKTIYIPTPTWGNHWKIFEACGLKTAPYRYYSRATNRLDIDGLLKDLQTAEPRSIILLHACAHNPTGCDPTVEQWKQIADVIEKRQHLVFFDSAYQGFASGDAEKDAFALRYFVQERQLPVMLAQSFAKNFGLYGERCGTLSVVCTDTEEKDRILSQLKTIVRPMYSSPPRHGSSLVKTVLQDEELTAQYYQECAGMANRIQQMRTLLVERLAAAGSTHDWSHVTQQIGTLVEATGRIA